MKLAMELIGLFALGYGFGYYSALRMERDGARSLQKDVSLTRAHVQAAIDSLS